MNNSALIKLLYFCSKLTLGFSILFSLAIIPCLILGSFGKEVNLKVNLETGNVFWEKYIEINDSKNELYSQNIFPETSDTVAKTQNNIDKINLKTLNNYQLSLNEGILSQYYYLHNLPQKHRILILISSLVTLFLLILISYYLMIFMQHIHHGNYFELKTMRCLKNMAYILIFIWLDNYTSKFILDKFKNVVNETSETYINVVIQFPNISLLVCGLMLWLVAHIFSHGIILKEENKYTI